MEPKTKEHVDSASMSSVCERKEVSELLEMTQQFRFHEPHSPQAVNESGATVNTQDSEENQVGWSALMSACVNGHYKLVKFLLEKGRRTGTDVAVNMQTNDEYGFFALFFAAALVGNCDTIKLLIENGAKVNMHTKFGMTSLIKACEQGLYDVVKLLIEKGAEVNMPKPDGWSALMAASLNGHFDIVKLLLENHAEANMQTDYGGTALLVASMSGHCGVVKLLIEKGAVINMQTSMNGWSALMLASEKGYCDVVRLLIENGAQMNLVNDNDQSALILATQNGHVDVVELLIENGANKGTKIGSASPVGSDDFVKTSNPLGLNVSSSYALSSAKEPNYCQLKRDTFDSLEIKEPGKAL